MKTRRALAAFPLLAFAGAQAAGPQAIVQSLMKDGLAPQSTLLWDIGGKAMDDMGHPDGTKLSIDDWTAIATTARSMKAVAASLATPDKLAVVESGGSLGDGVASGATAPMVQGYIEGEPKLFAEHAATLGKVADDYIAAAEKRDATKLQAASDALGLTCEACHAKFWYPEQ